MNINPSIRSRGYLPHWESASAIYFVTFRLADSLPRDIVVRLGTKRQTLENAERFLDGGAGQCHLRDPRIAKIVIDTLLHFDGERYQLLAWCVMPNHVHVLFSPLETHKLAAILHSWKSFSAEKANRLLGRSGAFWQREYFDHLVRNQSSLLRLIAYIRENPQKAGLQDWPWVSSAGFQPAVLPSHKSNRRQDGGATKSAS